MAYAPTGYPEYMQPDKSPLFYDTGTARAAFPTDATVSEIAAFLSARFAEAAPESGDNEKEDVPLVWPSHTARWDKAVRRLILALEWRPDQKSATTQTDTALFLHRPFDLPPGEAPGLLAVFASHIGFDAHFTTGYNPALARALQMTEPQPVRDSLKNDAVVGMIGDLTDAPTGDEVLQHVTAEFGGIDAVEMTDEQRRAATPRVAVMSALRPNLVADVAAAGATVYVTGQLRENARKALRERGMGVIAVGHRRSEVWGLHQLARELRSAFPALDVQVNDSDNKAA